MAIAAGFCGIAVGASPWSTGETILAVSGRVWTSVRRVGQV
jgi:hypothetical protein